MTVPPVVDRFLRYVRIDTTADPGSDTVPSSPGQLELGHLLVDELRAMGISDAQIDEHGYVYAGIPGTMDGPVIGLLAHLDTSPDAPGENVRPVIHEAYDGGTIHFPGDPERALTPEMSPELLDHIGHDIITSDGTTLLGSDDKAGVAILMQLAADLIANPFDHPPICICFTIDEEIGRGVDHIDLQRFDADVAYTIDGSGRDTIYAETFNATDVRLVFEGHGVHPGYAYGKLVNAVALAAEFISALPKAERPETTRDREGYFHAHRFTSNGVEHAEVELLLRDFSSEGIDARKDRVRSLVDRLLQDNDGLTIHLDMKDRYRNMREYIEQTDPRARTFAIDAAKQMGMVMHERPVRGGTDGARLSEMGVPTPNIFNGGHEYHSVYEWNSVQNLQHSLEYLKSLMKYWATNHEPEN